MGRRQSSRDSGISKGTKTLNSMHGLSRHLSQVGFSYLVPVAWLPMFLETWCPNINRWGGQMVL